MGKKYWTVVMGGGLLVLATVLMSQTKKPAGSTGTGKTASGVSKPGATTGKGVPAGGLKTAMARGMQVYHDVCLACHQADGLGVQNMNPPLVKTKYVLGDKTVLVQIVLKGMTGEVVIDDDTYHNVMAPHNDLSDQQISDVLTYIRNSFGNKASPVSVGEVKTIRSKTK